MATIGANGVRKTHFAALAALNQIHGLQRIMRSAAIATTLG